MTIPEICLRRPVMTTLLAISITVFGAVSFRGLPVSNLPNIDFPTIMVSASYPGAGPENMAVAVAEPLENEFASIEGVTSIISTNQLGSTSVTLQFSLNRDINSCALDVMTAINAATRKLPDDLPNPPTFRKVNPSLQPVMFFSLSSSALPLTEVDYYAETLLAKRISMVEGVADVNVYGAQKRAVRVRVDPSRLAVRGLTMRDLEAALADANVTNPLGTVSGDHTVYTLEADGQLPMAVDYRDLILARNVGGSLRLGDVAVIEDLPEDDKTGTWLNGKPAIGLAVERQPGANAVAVAEKVKAILPELRAMVPAAVTFNIMHDGSLPMVASVNEVAWTIFHTVVLVVAITYFFLQSSSATVIPSLALPISLLATGLIFAAFGFSIDTLSLMALMLAVGFVTDDAVVVMENVYRHLGGKKTPVQAAIDGAVEISFSVIGMTLSLAAVFIPFLLMGGVIGGLFSEFAIVITSAILISGIVSLTLTPLLCAKFLRTGQMSGRKWFLPRLCERGITGMTNIYARSLNAAFEWPRAILLIGLAMVAATAYLLYLVPKDFLPADDQGMLTVSTEAVQGASFAEMSRLHAEAAEIVMAHPDVERVMSSVGGSRNSMNNGSLMVVLKDFHPAGPRRRHPDAVAADLREALYAVPGLICYPTPPPAIRFGGRSSKSQYQFTLKSQDTHTLYPAAGRLFDALKRLPQLTDVATDLQMLNPTISIHIDRDKAYSRGISAADIENAMYDMFGSRQVSSILGQNDQYEVIIEGMPDLQKRIDAMDQVFLLVDGKPAPLSSVASWEISVGPMVVNHSEQQPAVTISFNTAPGVSLGDASGALSTAADRILPATVSREFQGSAQIFQDSMTGMFMLLGLAVAVIYVILGILYESYWHPLTILSGLPAAAAGGALTLHIFDRPLDIYGMVGMLLLIGLVKKNAILVVDFALEAMRKEKREPIDAAKEGSVQRFRPIMMTTLAALAAGVIIAAAGGQSGETRRGLGLVMSGGLVLSQVITLYLTPVVFQYVERVRIWLGGAKIGDSPTQYGQSGYEQGN